MYKSALGGKEPSTCRAPQNDTQTMARILADFILVLGDGQVATKADLLKDAASGQTKYEHQVDSNRTIRVWGDAAVITAKLIIADCLNDHRSRSAWETRRGRRDLAA